MQKNALVLDLLKKIDDCSAKIGVVGAGYVGLAVGRAFAGVSFKTKGFDISPQRVDYVNKLKIKNYLASTEFSDLSNSDIICICVPTPIDEKNRADYKILSQTVKNIARKLRRGQIIVLESSVAPGTSNGLILPALEKNGLILGKDFFFAHSPERIDPGNTKFTINNTAKVVGADDANSLSLVSHLYSKICEQVVPVSSIKSAELVKVLENTFRLVNISLINEISQFAKKIKVDIWEVVAAAATKPYGFLAHYPGPGIGGDCIPVIPYHLLSASKKIKVPLKVVESSLKVNELQHKKVVAKVKEVLGGPNGHTQKVMLVGVSYKEGVGDLRQSPALRIWADLIKEGIDVMYHDPYVPRVNGDSSCEISEAVLSGLDAIVVTTAHKNIPYKMLVASKKPVIDTRNILSKYKKSHIIKF